MGENPPTFDREQMRRWMENWREVNKAQDELVRSAPPPDPVKSLELGLDMITLAALHATPGFGESGREAEAERISQAWQRLRAGYSK